MLSVHSCPLGKLGGRDTGGMSVYIRELARELGKKGHHVDVYTRSHDPADPQVVEMGDGARLVHLEAGEVEDIHKLLVYSHLADFACGLENFRKRADLHYDLIHSHYWLSGWVGERVQRWWKVPHVTMFHTLGAVKNAIGIGEDDPELRTEAERELAAGCRIIAATQREKEQLVGHYGASPESVSVIPCGVNLELFRPLDRGAARERLGLDGGSIALFVGRIEPLKGIDRLLAAVAHLRRQRDVQLIIVGGDEQGQPEARRLQQLARDLRIQDSVTFTGMVRQEDLSQYYSAADVCVIPSYYESFGLVALESLACGTPVVATRVGGIESAVCHEGIGRVVGNNAPLRLAEEIGGLLSTLEASADTVAEARAAVARFSWSNIANQVLGEYRALLRDQAA